MNIPCTKASPCADLGLQAARSFSSVASVKRVMGHGSWAPGKVIKSQLFYV